MNRPTFSIVIPTYNRAEFLGRALRSLVAQTYKNFEVIVCDDGSTDHTKEVVSSFDNELNIKYIWEENWGGPARPRNNGVKAALSEWICFLDHDDWWYPNKLLVVSNYLDKADIIYHDLDLYKANGKTFRKLKARHLKTPILRDLLTTGANPIFTSSAMVKRELLDRVRLFDEDINLIAVEDFDLWLKLSRETEKFLYLDKCLGAYWSGNSNITQTSEIQYNRLVYIYKKYLPLLTEQDRFQAGTILCYLLGRIQQKRGIKTEAKDLYRASMKSKNLKITIKSLILLMFLSCSNAECGRC